MITLIIIILVLLVVIYAVYINARSCKTCTETFLDKDNRLDMNKQIIKTRRFQVRYLN